MIAVNDLILTSIETISAFDIVTGDYKFTLDELQSVTLANGQETTDITGKQGRKLGTLKRNKSVTVSGNDGLISGGLLEMQTGSEWVSGETQVMWYDYLTVSGDQATTTYKAVGTSGNEIAHVYVKDSSGLVVKDLTQNTEASDTEFKYTPDTKLLEFSGLDDGTEIAVYYLRTIRASHIDNMSDVYSEKCKIYIDGFAEDKCANVYHVQFMIPKADFSGEFSLEMGGDQAVHAFEAEALSGACGTAGQLWSLTVFGEETEDAGDP